MLTSHLIAYAAATLVLFILDAIWLGFISRDFYQTHLGSMLADPFKIHVAAIFYLTYTIGVVVFAVNPSLAADKWQVALCYGALFGFLAYGTYDFTNLATLKNWPAIVTIVDVAWGTILTAITSVAAYFAVRQWG